ncbi:unnamed protein product [Owenia fusiformis]|uniref:Sushi, nidogen and EGF-like domain-containing protein 1 n=1 Tax=Owenia fusiformis TaxID=6347 RepID=A0A8S4MWU3_OWEFU|nr:unnamed protein product [Owenia fusiformis]
MELKGLYTVTLALVHIVLGVAVQTKCKCGKPPPIKQGSIKLSDGNNCRSIATYTCKNSERRPIPRRTLKCRTNGQWHTGDIKVVKCKKQKQKKQPTIPDNAVKPQQTAIDPPRRDCEKGCKIPVTPRNGRIVSTTNLAEPENRLCADVVFFQCRENYRLHPINGSSIKCDDSETNRWSDYPPLCIPESCASKQHMCQHGGKCIIDGEGSFYHCMCPIGTRGDFCEFGAPSDNPCDGYKCVKGVCKIDRNGEAYCKCTNEHAGSVCPLSRILNALSTDTDPGK